MQRYVHRKIMSYAAKVLYEALCKVEIYLNGTVLCNFYRPILHSIF